MAYFKFTWENLKYTIEEKESLWIGGIKKTTIIDEVSGFAFSKSVIAIMGASGCGKTTLLSLLSGQREGNKGVLKINGRIVNGKILRANSAFLRQKDVFFESLTIYEHLIFMASMCLNKSYKARILIIHKLLKDLNLDNMKYDKIQYLSSGEKRKVSLASNLLLDPHILFCDEPTSNLDSFNAISVVKLLESIALSGKIVFLTVHQPSSQLFQLFNNIILLSGNGRVVFQGSKENAKKFFENQGIYCPPSFNTADYLIKNIAIKSTKDEDRIIYLAKHFQENFNNDIITNNDEDFDAILLKHSAIINNHNFFYTIFWLIWRMFIDLKRKSKQHFTTFLIIMISAILIGLSYHDTDINKFGSIQSVQGALLLIVSELIFNQMFAVIYVFPGEIEIFLQEKNLYSALPYFLSKIFTLMPFNILHSLGFLSIYFIFLNFLSGFWTFFNMYFILLGACLGGSSLGLCLSALFPSVESIQLILVPLELICILLSGLWIKINSLSKIFAALKYLSPFYVSFESISIIFWAKIDSLDACWKENEACFHNGTEVLKNYDFNTTYEKVGNNALYLSLLIAIYCYIGYIGILRKRALYQL